MVPFFLVYFAALILTSKKKFALGIAMPIYEYQCTACGHRLESFQKMTDEPLKECPKCQQSALQKLISAAGFQLKGTGWYATDFKDKGKKEPKTEMKTENSTDNVKTGDGSQDAKDKTAH